MAVRTASPDDFDAWTALAREVEHLFGPMADEISFRDALMAALTGNMALCIDDEHTNDDDHALGGGIITDRESNGIAWLAVAGQCRGKGYGRLLLDAAIGTLDRARPITVQTFAPSCSDGAAARRLYLSAGFVDLEAADPTPAGVATVIMHRPVD